MTTRADIVTCARTWLGTRFHHQGRVKGVGCDCAGLVVGVAREMGLSDFDVTGYARLPDGEYLRSLCEKHMTRVRFADIKTGDVLLLRFADHPQHLAIVGDYTHGGMSMIHAYAPSKKVVETRIDGAWWDRAVGVYRLPGVE